MVRKKEEGRGAARRSRPSKNVARQTDYFRVAQNPASVHPMARGCGSVPTAPDDLERVIDKDRAFFRKHPHRSHRMRLAEQPELDALIRAGDRLFAVMPGFRRVIVVRQVVPGFRLRRLCLLPSDCALDASEAVCADLYAYLAGESGTAIGRIEAQRRGAVH